MSLDMLEKVQPDYYFYSYYIVNTQLFLVVNSCTISPSPWTQNVNWTGKTFDVLGSSYERSIYVVCPGSNLLSLSWLRSLSYRNQTGFYMIWTSAMKELRSMHHSWRNPELMNESNGAEKMSSLNKKNLKYSQSEINFNVRNLWKDKMIYYC